jgi:hypothetical protein
LASRMNGVARFALICDFACLLEPRKYEFPAVRYLRLELKKVGVLPDQTVVETKCFQRRRLPIGGNVFGGPIVKGSDDIFFGLGDF